MSNEKFTSLSNYEPFDTNKFEWIIKCNICLIANHTDKEYFLLFPNKNKYPNTIQLCKDGFLKLLQSDFKSLFIMMSNGKLSPRIVLPSITDSKGMRLDYFLLDEKFNRSYYVHYKDKNILNLQLSNIKIMDISNKNPKKILGHHICVVTANGASHYRVTIRFNNKIYSRSRSINLYGEDKAKKLIIQIRDKLIASFKAQTHAQSLE